MRAGWGQGTDADAAMFFPGSTVAAVDTYYDAHFMDHVDALEVTQRAGEVIARLRESGWKTAIVTNTSTALATRLVERAGFAVDAIVGSSDVGRPKPAPDMIVHACERLDVKPAAAVMIGDSVFDRDAASAAGVPFIAYRWNGGRRIDDLDELPDLVRRLV